MIAVSVIIPTYNAAALIRRTLDSVLAQGECREVIVVDGDIQTGAVEVSLGRVDTDESEDEVGCSGYEDENFQ